METVLRQERNVYWDNIKGFLIILVVFAHILFQFQAQYEAVNAAVDYIYMFHMPAFVFVSGYFGKSARAHSFESIIRLIFLYFVFNSIVGFLYGFSSLLVPMYSYWYLLALIVWRLTAHRIAKFREIRLILFAVALFVGFYPSVDNSFAAARIIGFYPHYMLGYQLSAEKSGELQHRKYGRRALPGLICAAAAGAIAFFAYRFFQYSDDALQMAGYGEPMDSFGRIVLYIISFLAIYALRCLSPDKKLPLLTEFGRNSLWIFILHRPVTLFLSEHLPRLKVPVLMLTAAAAALLICLVTGSRLLAKYLNRFLSDGTAVFTSDNPKITFAKLALLAVSLGFVVSVVLDAYEGVTLDDLKKLGNGETDMADDDGGEDILYPVMTAGQKARFDKAFRLTFAGDLILLEDQVKRAYDGSGYDFSEVFAYAAPYISSADYAVGVFEGPAAGAEAGYSSGNFDDEKELHLNYPDAFASAVKDAGFDLVTTANNHLLDKGEKGALRTLDVLEQAGLAHTGSYRSMEDKEQNCVRLIECQGIRMAVLSYTYGSNYISAGELIDGRLSYLTSVITDIESEQFEACKKNVEKDFKAAKALSPDLIVVMPHIGTQFSNEPDEDQEEWFRIFKQNGADIILGDHPHVVEPALLESYHGKTVFTAYCPGNFANSYRQEQGDTSMLTDVYIDRETKEIIGGSIVPLYTHARADGNYRAVPVYDIVNDADLRAQLTTDDIDRAANANSIITEVVFGHRMDLSAVTERYYFDENGFLRTKTGAPELTAEMKQGTLYQAMTQAKSICFIGDSVTEGTKNGGCPWYEPLEACFPEKEIRNYSKGGCTVSYMTETAAQIPAAELYVIAIGTNDVRYRDESLCAMTPDQYTDRLDALKNKLLSASPGADFVFIAPWYSTDGDPFCTLPFAEKTALNEAYSAALGTYCKENGLKYINANDLIREKLSASPERDYLLDHIHPNPGRGVRMYTEAVLLS